MSLLGSSADGVVVDMDTPTMQMIGMDSHKHIPSQAQKQRFKEMAGYPLKDGVLSGKFSTDRPFDAPWEAAPWQCRFTFDEERGYLFCELSHQLTSNRVAGWDEEGTPLDARLVEAVYPIYYY